MKPECVAGLNIAAPFLRLLTELLSSYKEECFVSMEKLMQTHLQHSTLCLPLLNTEGGE